MRRTRLFLMGLSLIALSLPSLATTAHDALAQCQSQLFQSHHLAKPVRFHKHVAVTNHGADFRLLINAVADSGQERSTMKVECVTDAEGQVTKLQSQPGRWSM